MERGGADGELGIFKAWGRGWGQQGREIFETFFSTGKLALI